ncbi:MAG: amidase family protein [Pirellulales bacterium]
MPHDSSTQSPLIAKSGTELAGLIASGDVSSEEVVAAHIARIEQVNPALNAVVVPLFDSARRQAAEADQRRRRGEPLGALHGVPVTVKECFNVAGTDATLGVKRLVGRPSPHDGPLARRLRAAGAIILGKTNVPQLMLLHETDNPVYGRTNNPWDASRGPGGSSGGEAAIIAAGGSPLGLGSDLGGSIRQPAHSCGICGLKPTSRYLTNVGSRLFMRGMQSIVVSPGPLARSVADLRLALEALRPQSEADTQFDESMAPRRAAATVDVSRLRIGMWTDDGFFAPSPAIRRGVREAADALRRCGAEVEAIDPPDAHELLRIYLGIIGADGGRRAAKFVSGSPSDWRIRRQRVLMGLHKSTQRATAALLAALGQRHSAELLGVLGRKTADQYWDLTEARDALAHRFLAQLDEQRIDAVLSPPHALPAMRHGDSIYFFGAATYCYLLNLLGMPAGVVPVTHVQPSEQSDRTPSRDLVFRRAARCERQTAGLPVGAQVFARRWREDIVLAVMAAIEEQLPEVGRIVPIHCNSAGSGPPD